MHRRIHDQFSVVLRTESGNKFHGEFGDPNAYPRPRKDVQNLPHRALVTHRHSETKEGDLVRFKGVKYLLCGQHTLTTTKRYLAIEINKVVRWTRNISDTDPVTGMARSAATTTVMNEELEVTYEPRSSIEEENFQQSKDRIFTASEIRLDDEIDGKKVERVDNLFGIYMAEII
jgi:hypothetical protein